MTFKRAVPISYWDVGETPSDDASNDDDINDDAIKGVNAIRGGRKHWLLGATTATGDDDNEEDDDDGASLRFSFRFASLRVGSKLRCACRVTQNPN